MSQNTFSRCGILTGMRYKPTMGRKATNQVEDDASDLLQNGMFDNATSRLMPVNVLADANKPVWLSSSVLTMLASHQRCGCSQLWICNKL